MAEILDIQTVGDALIISCDTNPTTGGGTAAPVGCFAIAQDGSGTFYKGGLTNTDWYRLSQSNDNLNQNLLLVRKNPTDGQYATIEDALNAITTNSDTNPFVISVGVGIFEENQINCKPYVSIVGTSIQDTIIKPLGNHDLFVVTDVMTELSFMSLQSVPAGKAAIFCNDNGDYFQAHKVNFVDCDINVKLISVTQDTVAYLEYIDYNGAMTYGNHVTSTNGFRATLNVENYYTFPSASGFTADLITGTDAFLIITSSGIYGNIQPFLPPVAGNYAIICENGANISVVGSTIAGFETAILNNNVGTGCLIDCVGVMLDDNTNDIIISHPSTEGAFSGAADLSKITIDPASTFTGNFSQPHAGGGYIITGNIYNGEKVNEVAEITTLIKNQALGLISGGLSDGGGFQVDVSAGEGYLLDGNILKKIEWINQSITLAANQTKYIYFNASGVLTTSNTQPAILTVVLLGRVNTNGSTIQFIDKSSFRGNHTANKLTDLMREVFGSLFYFGCITTENATPFKVDVTNGEYYYGANEFAPTGGSAITFDKYYRDGSGGWTIVAGVDTIPNDKYDNGSGTLQNMTAGFYAKGVLYVVGDGADERYFFVYPQAEYAIQNDAENAPLPIPPTYFSGAVVRIASFVVQQGAGSITTVLDERPTPTTNSSATAASSDHLSLSNLTSGNAGHSQFYMLNGSTPLAANMNAGGYNFTNAGTFNSVVVETHASRHLPNGADPLTTGVPSTIGTVNAEGIQNAFARQDHVHAHGVQTDPTLHAVATALVNGFLSSADWTIFNNKQNALGYVPVNKAGDSGVGLITFLNNQGIDVDLSGGTDTLNIGTANADVINIGYSGSTVNIIGTLSYQNVDNLQVKDKLFTVNKGGGIGSGSSAGFEIEEASAITGWFATSGTRDGWDFKAPASFQMTLNLSALSATRTLSAPDLSGTIATINGGQTFTSATWNASVINAIYGGTGQSVYAVGDILYADTTTSLARLADVSAGSYLRSGGVGVAPVWSTLKLPNTATTGDLLYASSANTISNLADVAVGSVLVSGGVGVAPSWSATPTLSDLTLNNLIGTFKLYGTQNANTANSNTISNTIAETNFTGTGITLTVPANSVTVGTRIKVTGWGIYNRAVASNLTVRLKIGATTLLTTPVRAMSAATNLGFRFEAIVTFRSIGAGGTVSCDLMTLFSEGTFANGSVVASNGTKTWNTTASQTLQFSAQFSVANAGNNITLENVDYEILRN